MPHVYGNTRADVALRRRLRQRATLRLFQMDVLRHTGPRQRSPSWSARARATPTCEMDVDQLRVADYTEAELQEMIDTAAAAAGAGGRSEVKQDLLDYVAGINAVHRRGAQRSR